MTKTLLTFDEAIRLKNALFNRMTQSVAYTSWSADFARQFAVEGFADGIDKYEFDPHGFTLKQLYELGFRNWDDKVVLVPLWLHRFLKAGIVLTDISGDCTTVSYDETGKSNIDNDTRGGLLAYGVEIKNLQPADSQRDA